MRCIYVIFLSCFFISCTGVGKEQSSTISEAILEDSIIITTQKRHNPLCDSLYVIEDWSAIEYSDTIIYGKKYAYAMPLVDGYILVSPRFNKEYGMWESIQILSPDHPNLDSGDPDYDLFSEFMIPSPSKCYIFYLSYYETGRIDSINDEGEVTETYLKYSGAYILDIKKDEVAASFYGGEGVDGAWNYCNQWQVDGEVLFDPEQM